MRSECFLDTNVLVYAAAGRPDEERKRQISRELIATTRFCLSGQVLAEFYSSLSTKAAIQLPLSIIDEWLEMLAEFPVEAVGADLVRSAILISRRFRIAYWDAAIIAAAERLEAPVLFTEDLNHGQRYGTVTVMNPFR